MRLLFCKTLLVVTGLVLSSAVASAAPFTIIGNSTLLQSTATGELTLVGSTLTLTLTNTSPFEATLTGIGFDLDPTDFVKDNKSAGLNGFTATGSTPGFTFSDGLLGNVPQFNDSVLDFGWLTGKVTKNNTPDFTSGDVADGIAPLETMTFVVNGNFAGFTEQELIEALFVRFQNVGPNGGSDVGRRDRDDRSVVPEPASLLLFGSGLLAAVAARRRKLSQL